MAVRYCTFWYPTIYHTDLTPIPLSNTIEGRDISDGADKKYFISITVDNQENLTVKSTINQDDFYIILSLDPKKKRRNGFVQYSFNLDNLPAEHHVSFEKVLEKDIYHIAKEFYHKHEADPDKDSALRAIISPSPQDIEEDDNEILIKFLECYHPVFEKYAKNISSTNFCVQQIESFIDRIERESKERNIPLDATIISTIKGYKNDVLNKIISMNNMCENALIEYTYYKTLLCSKHNKSFHHTLAVKNDEKDYEIKNKWRMYALNIRNSIRYIENIKYKNQNRLYKMSQYLLEEVDINTKSVNKVLDENKKTERITESISWFSVALAIVLGIPVFFKTGLKLIDIIWGILTLLIILGFGVRIITLYRKKQQRIVSDR